MAVHCRARADDRYPVDASVSADTADAAAWDEDQQAEPTSNLHSLSTPSSSPSAGVAPLTQPSWV